MKSLTIHTLIVAVALLGTSSMAAAGELSTLTTNPTEQRDTHSANAATSAAPLFALSGLDAQSLADQEMTDQELKAVEGGQTVVYHIDLGFMGQVRLYVWNGEYCCYGFYNDRSF